MKISVVTAAYNAEKTIGYTIESFVRQTHEDREMIVVDGLSRDRTVEIVRSFNCDKIRIVSERDAGIYDAMNKGLRLFAGDAVGFLNADDCFHDEHAVAAIASALASTDIAYGNLLLVDNHLNKAVRRVWRTGRYGRAGFRLGWMPPHPTFYVRRAVVDSIGGFDRKYTIASDYDFMVRAMTVPGMRDAYVERFLVDYQLGGTSSNGLKAMYVGNLESLKVRREHLGHGALDAALFLRLARRFLQLKWTQQSAGNIAQPVKRS
jgi:glycosyltransferase